jgi:hypothetical protein
VKTRTANEQRPRRDVCHDQSHNLVLRPSGRTSPAANGNTLSLGGTEKGPHSGYSYLKVVFLSENLSPMPRGLAPSVPPRDHHGVGTRGA